jgi:hypothetical protein
MDWEKEGRKGGYIELKSSLRRTDNRLPFYNIG